jgi:anti-sigma regulatory factor (Ser/Thr protein kinase)
MTTTGHLQEEIPIRGAADVGVCRRRASHLAVLLGFDDTDVGRVAILATELAENVLRHGGGKGEFRLKEVNDQEGRRGIEVSCSDEGPGLDTERDFLDGFSTGSSLGIGLGAVARMADSCDVLTPPSGRGVEIVCRKWLKTVQATTQALPVTASLLPVDVGARSRPYPGLKVNGDAYVMRFLGGRRILAAVIDGLGHGIDAHEAAVVAQRLVETHGSLNLVGLFQDAHQLLRRTRGVVMAVAVLYLDERRIEYLGVGNIEAVLINEKTSTQLTSLGGTVGHSMRSIRSFEYPWDGRHTLVMCTDGIRSAWRTQIPMEILHAHPDILTETILSGFSREKDDATAIGIREKR